MAEIAYIHGMGPKPDLVALKKEWDQALFGEDKSSTEMAYWADILHPLSVVTLPAMLQEAIKEHTEYCIAFEKQEIFGDVLLRAALRYVSQRLLIDVYSYFYDERARDHIKARLAYVLGQRVAPQILISHSLGTIIAYEVLCETQIPMPMLLTIGSPLGNPFVQAELRKSLKTEKLEKPPSVWSWVNIADPLDIVSRDTTIADEYGGDGIYDIQVENLERDTRKENHYGPHSISGYLGTESVREVIAIQLNQLGG